MSLARSVSYDLGSFFRWLAGGPARGQRVAGHEAGHLGAAKKPAVAEVKEPAKTVRKAKLAEASRRARVSPAKPAVEEAEHSKAECEAVLAACIEESLVAEGYVTSPTMAGDLPGIQGENLAGERVVVALGGHRARYKLEGFKGSSCADLAARLDAQMARRGLVVTEENTESDASESSSEAQARERRQGCPRR